MAFVPQGSSSPMGLGEVLVRAAGLRIQYTEAVRKVVERMPRSTAYDFEFGVKRLAVDPYKNDSVPYAQGGPGQRYARVAGLTGGDVAAVSYEVVAGGLLVREVDPPPPAPPVHHAPADRPGGRSNTLARPVDWDHYWSTD